MTANSALAFSIATLGRTTLQENFMQLQEVFHLVRDEYSEAIALRVFAIYCVQQSQKATTKDLVEPGRFAQRQRKRAGQLLWSDTDQEFNEAYAIAQALHDYDVARALSGLGGATPKTLRQLVHQNALAATSAIG